MTPAPLSKLTVRLHWLVAAAMIGLFALGQVMSHNELLELYPLHKGLGILVLLLVLPRVLLRLKEGWPAPVAAAPPAQERLAKVVHWALLIATVAMPVSGIMMSGAGGHGLAIFGLELLSANPDPASPGEVIPFNATLAGIGYFGHQIGSKLLLLALVLHVAGAVKHHLVDKDATLTRMLGR